MTLSCCSQTSIEKIKFVSKSDTLVGYLNKPESVDNFSVVVVTHSASLGKHDSQIYNHLVQTFNRVGVGVFTYDRRGSGESGGDFFTASLEDLAKDALKAIDALKGRKDVKKIGIFGVSQGGWIAPLAYNMNNQDISFMILVSSSGVSPAVQMDYATQTNLKRKGFNDKDISNALYLRSIINNYYRGKMNQREAQKIIDSYRGEKWVNESSLPLKQNMILPDNPKLSKWYLEMDFNPEEYFSKINIPIALFYGSYDIWVPIDKSIELWKKALKKCNNNSYEVFRIKNSGHLMIIDEDSNPKENIISKEYTELLQNWIMFIILLDRKN
jgi:pimeloyl-ACP methyl ester carboxylesterase